MHGQRALQNHEKSSHHLKAVQIWNSLIVKEGQIVMHLEHQEEAEKRYWRDVLHRVVECLKFLCERGLALRGENENIGDSHNGNFLGALQFVAKFDPFLAEHLKKRGNPGKGHVSYLSSTTYEELIILMGERVLKTIVDELQTAKYFSVVVDSSPDTAHCDQLAIILRYVKREGTVQERFICYQQLSSHTGKSIANVVLEKLKELGINIHDGRGQSYDNASNMSGRYNGLQSHLK
jgi:hypothetical protein